MVTAELAVALPAVLLVAALCLVAVSVGIDQVRCVDAARLGARAAARGDPGEVVRAEALRVAPSGAEVSVRTGPTEVSVTVTAVRSSPGASWLGSFPVQATSSARREMVLGHAG